MLDEPLRLSLAIPQTIVGAAAPVARGLINLVPGLRPSLESAIDGRTVLVTGASSGIGRALAVKVAGAGGRALLVARRARELEELRRGIEAGGGVAHVYPADLSELDSIDPLIEQVMEDHGGLDVLINNAGRSIRRSVSRSYDRFHDYERTMQLNYFAPVRLIMAVLPQMRAVGSGHIVNVSTLGVQASTPRFSAYIASKAALEGFTRSVAAEAIGDGVAFSTVYMPLVRTPMSAPTRLYDRLPALSADQGADLVAAALRTRARQVGPRLGTATEIAYALVPGSVDRIAGFAYRLFSDSLPSGDRREPDRSPSLAQMVFARLTRGVYW
jgi:NAD(P)-dependent dehydrogenase (short-subunit alcohol dehydrogenase family)